MNKFNGSIEELQGLMASVAGEWSNDGNGKHTFRTKDGGVMNWWRSKGTLQLKVPRQVRQGFRLRWQ